MNSATQADPIQSRRHREPRAMTENGRGIRIMQGISVASVWQDASK
jgi:hypothetical protein